MAKLALHWVRFIFWLAVLGSCHSIQAKQAALIIYGDAKEFQEVIAGLTDDLESLLTFKKFAVSKQTSGQEIAAQLQQVKPKAVVLIGNNAINAYHSYQQQNRNHDFPPSVALAALYIDQQVVNLRNATGISYEVPAVISAINLRALMQAEIKSIGVIYRKWMQPFIEENRRYLKAEGIELIDYQIESESPRIAGKVIRGIEYLRDHKVDAYWIVNDNVLLSRDALLKGWLAQAHRIKQPIIVGVKSLLATPLNFGSYAIIPDHYGLGLQGASVLADIMDAGWKIQDPAIEQPWAVKKFVNLSVFEHKDVAVIQSRLGEVDEVMQ